MAQNVFPLDSLAESRTAEIKPLYFPRSVLFFGIPAALLAAGVWIVWPALMAAGMPRGVSNAVVFITFNSLLIVAALVAYALEGNPFTWRAFIARNRLQLPDRNIWLWALGGFLVAGVLALTVNSLTVSAFNLIGVKLPDQSSGLISIPLLALVLLTNIVGEELWWRGYILPRQELAHGKFAWLVQGLMWACFHAFKPWAIPAMLIFCQIEPFIAQRTRNNWPPMIIHFLVNGSGLLMTLLG
jgi:membrane protease YdiL (CAAX protease family)